jgi:hypothetical protein
MKTLKPVKKKRPTKLAVKPGTTKSLGALGC